MPEILAVRKTNGLKVASTFSGCGGSCLGFEMTGYDVVWANEFVEAARDTYAMNHPGVILDGRDIRTVEASDILAKIGMAPGELDVFEGSPQCASFSMAGKREKGWGKVNGYSDTVQRSDDLFFEFARLLGGLKPKVFVAENVSGLVKGAAFGYFNLILKELRSHGYRVKAQLLDAQWLGVAQSRQRIIFMGVREDLEVDPVFPTPLPYRYSISDALPWVMSAHFDSKGAFSKAHIDGDKPISTVTAASASHWKAAVISPEHQELSIEKYAIGKRAKRLKPGEADARFFNLIRPDSNRPCPTITALGGAIGASSVIHPAEMRKFTIAELKRLSSFPDDFALTGSFVKQWERVGRSVPPVMMAHVARTIRDSIFRPLGMVSEGAAEAMP